MRLDLGRSAPAVDAVGELPSAIPHGKDGRVPPSVLDRIATPKGALYLKKKEERVKGEELGKKNYKYLPFFGVEAKRKVALYDED